MADMEGSTVINTSKEDKDDDEEVAVLPGFRFHPTDEELVGFYLKRKVDKRPITIELIKHIDIYKFDPWDLPKGSNVGDKEWYFFCKRGRKYRNSIRPNRVTGSGFWKATGIDRPIYSGGGGSRDSNCIGLKKSLVYYRGSAGKGTKTDWMMHEFRLPSQHDTTANTHKHHNHSIDPKTIAEEAEVWTLCRIFKRNVSYRKCIPEWKELAGGARAANINNYKQQQQRSTQMNEVLDHMDASSKTCSLEFDHPNNYISFTTSCAAAANTNPTISVMNSSNKKPYMNAHHLDSTPNHSHNRNQQFSSSSSSVSHPQALPLTTNNVMNMNHGSSLGSAEFSELLKQGEWDELRLMFESAAAAPLFHL